MTKEHTGRYKKEMAQHRAEENKIVEEIAIGELRRNQAALPPVARRVKLKDEKQVVQIYEDWLKEYKKKNPDFKEEENTINNKNGVSFISFSDPQAEEDFVRYLAAKGLGSEGILDKGILIAKFELGKLIDPRTNQEFPQGGYAKLVQDLDAGIAYNDIPASDEPTAPTPCKITP